MYQVLTPQGYTHKTQLLMVLKSMIKALTAVQEVFRSVRKHRQGTANNVVVKNPCEKSPWDNISQTIVPRAEASTSPGNLVKSLGPHPKTTESETLEVESSNQYFKTNCPDDSDIH